MSEIINRLMGKEVDFFLPGNKTMYNGTVREFDGVVIRYTEVTYCDESGKLQKEAEIITNMIIIPKEK